MTPRDAGEITNWADIIIVGAGTAGCVLADQLSRFQHHKVLLLEAGPRDWNPWIHIPVGFSRLLHNKGVNWCFTTESQHELAERRLHWPRGRVLGGSGAINGMVWVRGQPNDYDAWAESTGDPGWAWHSVEPIFRAIEAVPNDADERLGRAGEMPLSRLPVSHPLVRAFIRAAAGQGYPQRGELSISDDEGFGEYLISTRSGIRASPATIYLKPAMKRPNLKVATLTRVLSMDFGDDRVRAVNILVGTQRQAVYARRAIVLSAGAVGSPHLLMLSGIGPGDSLRRAGIKPHLDIPGVGGNLQDHFGVRVVGRTNKPLTVNDDFRRPWRLIGHAVRYAVTRGGPMAIGGAYAGAFYRSGENVRYPDIQLHFLPLSSQQPGWRFDAFSGFTVNVCHLRPFSRGRITLRSADPLAAPSIDPGYLSDPRDLAVLVKGLQIARRILREAPLSTEYGAIEQRPGVQVQDSEELIDYIRATGQTVYHPVGTCRMGADVESVVTPQLRVRGIRNLWIIDASIMPTIPSGNTHAAVLMLAHRGAQFVSDTLAHREDS
jgi:choline dehydrogenase